jgi:acyl-CoA thioester hydrolase
MLDGYFKDKVFILPIRIYYADTDLSGVVYHANYLNYMERARSEYFRRLDIKVADLDADEPTAWALRKAELEYIRPAKVDDLIEVHTITSHMTGARLEATQTTYCNGELLVRGKVQACVVTLSGKPRRIPQSVRDKIQPFLYKTES